MPRLEDRIPTSQLADKINPMLSFAETQNDAIHAALGKPSLHSKTGIHAGTKDQQRSPDPGPSLSRLPAMNGPVNQESDSKEDEATDH